jgi:membrane protein implicated in regulation of membrane protease activity
MSGLVIAAIVLWLFRAIFNATQASSESRIAMLPGVSATVITPIPANGVGEIAYVQGGSRYTAPAREETGAAVGNGAAVKIKRVLGTQYYVSLE